jgi:hypothetical protein
MLRLVGRSVRRARDGVILKSTTSKGGLLLCRRAYNGDNDEYNTQVDEIVGGADPSPEYDRCYRGESSLYTRG